MNYENLQKIYQQSVEKLNSLNEKIIKDTESHNLEKLSKWHEAFKDNLTEALDYEKLLIELGFEGNGELRKIEKIVKVVKKVDFTNFKSENPLTEAQSHWLKNVQLLYGDVQQLLQQNSFKKNEFIKGAFLVEGWTKVLQFLEKVSLFYWLRRLLPSSFVRGNYRFVDGWIILHSLLAFFFVVIAGYEAVPSWLKYVFLVYGSLRMFEILIYQLNVILVHPYTTMNYSLNSYRRMTIALLHNFFEIVFWFAGTFMTLQYITDNTVPMAVYTSFTHMVTYSMELDDSKWSLAAVLILQFQALIGVFMTILSLARFVSLFPQPMSLDPMEQEANEERHKHLMHKLIELEQQVRTNKSSIQQLEQEEEQHKTNPNG